MNIPYFTSGPSQLRQKLNDMIRAINSLDRISGDQFIRVDKSPSALALSLSLGKLEERLRMFSSGSIIHKAYCKDDAGAATTIDCYLDADDPGSNVISVHCEISGGGNLDSAEPRLEIGDLVWVVFDGTNWHALHPFQATEDCECTESPLAIADGGTGATTAPGAASALGVGTEDSPVFTGLAKVGTGADYLAIVDGIVSLHGTAQCILTLRPHLDYDSIRANGAPTRWAHGVSRGFSLATGGGNEVLTLIQNVPSRWNGNENPTLHITVCLSQAEDVGDKFKLRTAWEKIHDADDTVEDTSNNVDTEQVILAGRTAIRSVYTITFEIDYDIDPVDPLTKHDELFMEISSLVPDAPAVTGEIVILNWHIHWPVNKMFMAP